MAGLNERDIEVLKHYAAKGNRLLYFNYLAQHEGSDGYGVLAVGVVRNDNMPGAIANSYAQYQAKELSGRQLSEREWENFGQNLMEQDFKLREAQMSKHRPDLALNLPAKDIQKSHDIAYGNANINPNAWTPRHLLEAARRQGGEPAAESVWHAMLDSSKLGAPRLFSSLGDVITTYGDRSVPTSRYGWDLGTATLAATQSRDQMDPNVIGSERFYCIRSAHQPEWSRVTVGAAGFPATVPVTDKREIAELEDARAVRLERQQKATEFHPLDPSKDRPLVKSPKTIADGGLDVAPTAMTAPATPQLTSAARQPSAAPGSIDDLFTRLTDAAMAGNMAGMRAVSREYTASPDGQQWLQAGRDHNQREREAALAAQQAQEQAQAQAAAAQYASAQQAAHQQSGPVMRL